MSVINYNEIHTINLPVEHMSEILKMIDPASYLRLFETQVKEASYDKNKSDRLNQQNEMEALKKENTEEKARSRNLMSLSLIYKIIKSTKYNNGFCTVRLNTMLTFELYSSLSININKNRKQLDNLYKKQEKFDFLTPEYQNIQEEVESLFATTEALKELNDYVVKVLRPEVLFELMEHYRTLSPLEHAQKCLL